MRLPYDLDLVMGLQCIISRGWLGESWLGRGAFMRIMVTVTVTVAAVPEHAA